MIHVPIEIGDLILTGKFKNKKVIVKEISIDEFGNPTVNGTSIMKIRIPKLYKKMQENNMKRLVKESVAAFQRSPIQVKVKQDKDDTRWKLFLQTVDGEECLSMMGYETKELANHAALTKGYVVGNDLSDEPLPETVEVPKPTKRETIKGIEKPEEIKLEKEKKVNMKESKLMFVKDRNISAVTKKYKLTVDEIHEYEQSLIAKTVPELRKLQSTVSQQQDKLRTISNPTTQQEKATAQLEFREIMIFQAIDFVAFEKPKMKKSTLENTVRRSIREEIGKIKKNKPEQMKLDKEKTIELKLENLIRKVLSKKKLKETKLNELEITDPGLVKKAEELARLANEYDRMKNEMAKIKEQMDPLDEEFTTLMDQIAADGDRAIETKNVLITIKKKGNPKMEVAAYKERFEWLYERVNGAMKKNADDNWDLVRKFKSVATSLAVQFKNNENVIREDNVFTNVIGKLKSYFTNLYNVVFKRGQLIDKGISELKKLATTA